MLPGVAVHVVQRGNNRAACFVSDEDRKFYLFHLARILPRAGCLLHAYCLMTNHVHLLLTTAESTGCGRLIKGVGELYARYFNRSYKKSGHVWEGRFKSCLVESEEYVLACYRYIELNPVRACIASDPARFGWSSYRSNALGESSAMLTAHEQYLNLGRDAAERQAVYRDLFGEMQSAERLEEIRNATNGGYVLGSAAFKRAIEHASGRRVDKGKAGRRPAQSASNEQGDLLAGK